MRAFSIAFRKARNHAVIIKRSLKTSSQLRTSLDGPASITRKGRIDRDVQRVFPSFDRTSGQIDHVSADAIKAASALDAFFLYSNTLIQRTPQGDQLATTIALRLFAEQHINSTEDARTCLAHGWSVTGQVHDAVAQAFSVRIVEVLCQAGGAAYLRSALDLFVSLLNQSNDKTKWSKASRDVVKALASIPPSSPLSKTKTEYLESIMKVIGKHGLRLRQRGYEAILNGTTLSPKLLAAIQRDPEGRRALQHHKDIWRHIVGLTKQGSLAGAQALTRTNKAGAVSRDHVAALTGANGSRYTRRQIYLMNKAQSAAPFQNDTRQRNVLQEHFQRLIRSKNRTTASLLATLENMEKEEYQPTLDVATYTTILKALIKRKEWKAAWDIWVRLRTRCFREARSNSASPEESRAWRLDPMALSIGVILLCRYKADFAEAFRMVDGLGSIDSYVAASVGIPIDTFLLNGLMEELARAHRTEAIYPLWQEMSRQYGVERDQVTLRTLLDATVLGSVGGETDASMGSIEGIATAMADGFSRMIIARRQRKRTQAVDQTQVRFAYRMDVLLSGKRCPRDEVLWDGMAAWQRARLIFLEVALGNWPGLVNVASPASADAFARGLTSSRHKSFWVQPTAKDLLTPPSTALPVHQHIEFQSNVNPHVIPSPPTTSLYPHIILDDATFQAYIRLLGEHNLAAQIPLTLAWMRALGIIPSRKTLSLSLAYFREVTTSMQPLVYAYGNEGSGEYGGLVQWVKDWVPEVVPSEDAIVTTWARAKRKRELAELWDT
ncbi:hypothetical protein FRC04_002225 [Tulasnella sp. 424]|nr:hypothetical protein FRC04_002225 [Tulasnella sp. 424]KAG8969702.1 hypothetical protein FRC05_000833 [Tulasnella sp. 425]